MENSESEIRSKLDALSEIVFGGGNTPLRVHGFDEDKMIACEQENPQIAKHYPCKFDIFHKTCDIDANTPEE